MTEEEWEAVQKERIDGLREQARFLNQVVISHFGLMSSLISQLEKGDVESVLTQLRELRAISEGAINK